MKLLKWNDEISFGANGTIKDYAVSGWALGEDNPLFTWTSEREARIKFNAQATASAVELRLAGMPFLADGQIAFQRVWVHLNGMYCGLFDASAPFEHTLPLRNAWIEPRGNMLTLTLPDVKSPKELGLGEDQRRLGIAVRGLSFCIV